MTHTAHDPSTAQAEEEVRPAQPDDARPWGLAEVGRRGVVAATGLVGLGVLAGCGSAGDGSSQAGSQGGGEKGGGGSGGGGGGVRVAVSDVPVGGGTILKQEKVVVTQPSKGQFKAFSAVCTHKGCTVSQVADGTIDCPCHGSRFSVENGSVEGGPAPRPLEAMQASVQGGDVVVS